MWAKGQGRTLGLGAKFTLTVLVILACTMAANTLYSLHTSTRFHEKQLVERGRALGRLISLGRAVPGGVLRFVWSPAQPLDPGADGRDGARAFVADHLREFDAVVHVAVEQMEVGTADSAVGDLDLDLARGGGDGDAGSDGDCPVT